MSQLGTNRNTDKFVVRLPHDLRERIASVAKQHHHSMNVEIIKRLENSLEDNTTAKTATSDMVDVGKIERRLTDLIQQFFSHLQDSQQASSEVMTETVVNSEPVSVKPNLSPSHDNLSEALDHWTTNINIDNLISTLKVHLQGQDSATQNMLVEVLVLWRSSQLSMLHSLDEARHSVSRQIDVIEQCIEECQQQSNE